MLNVKAVITFSKRVVAGLCMSKFSPQSVHKSEIYPLEDNPTPSRIDLADTPPGIHASFPCSLLQLDAHSHSPIFILQCCLSQVLPERSAPRGDYRTIEANPH